MNSVTDAINHERMMGPEGDFNRELQAVRDRLDWLLRPAVELRRFEYPMEGGGIVRFIVVEDRREQFVQFSCANPPDLPPGSKEIVVAVKDGGALSRVGTLLPLESRLAAQSSAAKDAHPASSTSTSPLDLGRRSTGDTTSHSQAPGDQTGQPTFVESTQASPPPIVSAGPVSSAGSFGGGDFILRGGLLMALMCDSCRNAAPCLHHVESWTTREIEVVEMKGWGYSPDEKVKRDRSVNERTVLRLCRPCYDNYGSQPARKVAVG